MAVNVNVEGLSFDGPDKKVTCPSWDYIVKELSSYVSQICSTVEKINTNLGLIDDELEEWAESNGGV